MKDLIKSLRREEGFWSAFFVLTITALAVLSLTTVVTLKMESRNMVNQVNVLQTDYAATSGVFYGLNLLNNNLFDSSVEYETVLINDVTVAMDTSLIYSGGEEVVCLEVTSIFSDAEKQIVIELETPNPFDGSKAITAGEPVQNVEPRDEDGVTDYDLMEDDKDFDDIEIGEFLSMAQQQETESGVTHVWTGDYSKSKNYPNGSFWYSTSPDSVPNVIIVEGDFAVQGNFPTFGIFIVHGSVDLNGCERFNGVIYQTRSDPQEDTTLRGGGAPPKKVIDGGLITHGGASGTPQGANKIGVQYNSTYMRYFTELANSDGNELKILSWRYN